MMEYDWLEVTGLAFSCHSLLYPETTEPLCSHKSRTLTTLGGPLYWKDTRMKTAGAFYCSERRILRQIETNYFTHYTVSLLVWLCRCFSQMEAIWRPATCPWSWTQRTCLWTSSVRGSHMMLTNGSFHETGWNSVRLKSVQSWIM